MTSAQLVNLEGKSVGQVELNDTVFGAEPNTGVLFDALQRQLANARAGTAKAKTRAEVSGGGRKPWRQKGTGRARVGSIRSPLWAGGGVCFGPKPRDYTMSMPRKMRQLALRSALAAHKDSIVVVKDFSDLKEAKTKAVYSALKALGIAGKKILVVVDASTESGKLVMRAARNIDRLKVVRVNDINVKDLVDCEALLTSEQTLEVINARFKHEDEAALARKKVLTKVKAVRKVESEEEKAARAADAVARAEAKVKAKIEANKAKSAAKAEAKAAAKAEAKAKAAEGPAEKGGKEKGKKGEGDQKPKAKEKKKAE